MFDHSEAKNMSFEKTSNGLKGSSIYKAIPNPEDD